MAAVVADEKVEEGNTETQALDEEEEEDKGQMKAMVPFANLSFNGVSIAKILLAAWKLPIKFFGGRIYFHWSLIPLCAYMFYKIHYIRPIGTFIGLGFAMMALTLFGVFFHTFGHVFAYYYIYKIPCRMLALHFYGGFLIPRQMLPDINASVAVVSAMGPIFSFILAAVFAAPYLHYRGTFAEIFGVGIFFYYAFMFNLVMGIFNLLPIYPMAGGRAVKSLALLCFTEKQAVYGTVVVSVVCMAAVFIYAIFTRNWWVLSLLVLFAVSIVYEVKRIRAQKNTQHQQLEDQSSPKQQKQNEQKSGEKQPQTPPQQQATLQTSGGDALVDVSFETKKPEKKGVFGFFSK